MPKPPPSTEPTPAIAGALTQWTVPDHLRRLDALLAEQQAGKALDLSAVTRADSAAVALLLALRRRCGQPLRLSGVPEGLQQLIDFFHLRALITGE